MRYTRNHRPPFLSAADVRRGAGRRAAYVDISCDFVAVRAFRFAGKDIPAGAPFDKTQVNERRLRQLYEVRTIGLAPGSKPVTPPVRKLAIGPTDLIHPGQASAPKKAIRRGITRRAA